MLRHPCPPYCSFTVLLHVLDRLNEQGIPDRIDAAMFGRGHRALGIMIVEALGVLGLIEQDGRPATDLSSMMDAVSRRAALHRAVAKAYPTIDVDRADLTPGDDLESQLVLEYRCTGSRAVRAARFLQHACRYWRS